MSHKTWLRDLATRGVPRYLSKLIDRVDEHSSRCPSHIHVEKGVTLLLGFEIQCGESKMLKRLCVAVSIVFGCTILSGCSDNNVVQGEPLEPSMGAINPRLQSGDKLRITVFGEDKLTGEYIVDPAGNVALPLAGTVHAAGLTNVALESRLQARFRGTYLKEPQITVEVVNYQPVYVLGEVQKPGDYPYRSGLNVLRAIALAGGQTYRASRESVIIQRAGDPTLREYPLSANITLNPGDLVRLPERYF